MTAAYLVKVTEQAQEQMREIARYIAFELKAPDAALHMLDSLETAIASLARMPNSIALTEEEPWHSIGIHKKIVRNFLVYFWIDEDTRKVQVTAVVYGRRDQVQQLSQMRME